jgi:formate dehydrogenase subunit delta
LPENNAISRMELHHLIKMANDIGGFFAQMPREEAISSTAAHIKNFWEPRMRRQLIDYAQRDGGDLQELVRVAVLKLEPSPVPSRE